MCGEYGRDANTSTCLIEFPWSVTDWGADAVTAVVRGYGMPVHGGPPWYFVLVDGPPLTSQDIVIVPTYCPVPSLSVHLDSRSQHLIPFLDVGYQRTNVTTFCPLVRIDDTSCS